MHIYMSMCNFMQTDIHGLIVVSDSSTHFLIATRCPQEPARGLEDGPTGQVSAVTPPRGAMMAPYGSMMAAGFALSLSGCM